MKHIFPLLMASRSARTILSLFLGTALLFVCVVPSGAQKDKKKKNDTTPIDPTSMIPMSDQQQIEVLISDMLGAWQIGDTEKMHKDYADDLIMVNGMWAPPVFTWANYLPIYQQQRARMQQVRMDRINTYIKVDGNFAWACYQWDFSAVVDGQPSAARGQTTLVLEKRAARWLIVHNHTSLAPAPQPAQTASTPQMAQP